MEFNFIVSKQIPLDSQGIGIYEANNSINRHRQQSDIESNIKSLINVMGERSATAQGLKQVITQYEKMSGGGQKLYIIGEGRTCFGILKIGYKNLFYRDLSGNVKEIKPLCVLDFYVHENCQRQGYGKILFEAMLQRERSSPERFAYDRPSPKLIGFLRKHYGLTKYIQQNNNFVVFDAYFQTAAQNNFDSFSQGHRSNSSIQSISKPYQESTSQFNGNYRGQLDSLSVGWVDPKTYSLADSSIKQRAFQFLILSSLSFGAKNEFAKAGRAVLSSEDVYKPTLESSARSKQNYHHQPSPNTDQFWEIKEKAQIPQQQLAAIHDRRLDRIQQRIQQTEKEIDSVNQQIEKQKINQKHPPLPPAASLPLQNNYNQSRTQPLWSNTGFNYYQTSSSHYGNHYTYYGK